MPEAAEVFDQVPQAKVQIYGIRQLKDYLKAKLPSYQGKPVTRYRVVGEQLYVWCNTPNGEHRYFFGYTNDIARNVQYGLYEEVE